MDDYYRMEKQKNNYEQQKEYSNNYINPLAKNNIRNLETIDKSLRIPDPIKTNYRFSKCDNRTMDIADNDCYYNDSNLNNLTYPSSLPNGKNGRHSSKICRAKSNDIYLGGLYGIDIIDNNRMIYGKRHKRKRHFSKFNIDAFQYDINPNQRFAGLKVRRLVGYNIITGENAYENNKENKKIHINSYTIENKSDGDKPSNNYSIKNSYIY